jgi:hypothetical protein
LDCHCSKRPISSAPSIRTTWIRQQRAKIKSKEALFLRIFATPLLI